ncbi:MAG TPA: PA14 domain-containing protein [Polyangia bacterium]|nr:PA14 domain-containing protein [Polyangia bacterium]
MLGAASLVACVAAQDPTGVSAESAALSTGSGLHADYFSNQSLTAPATLSRTDATVNFNWGTGSPASSLPSDHFSVRWTGQVEALYSQTYTFTTSSDDGIRLWVNGQQIINNWTDHARTQNSGRIALTAGQRSDIRLEFYEDTGNASAQLSWASGSQPKQIIPSAQLYPPSTGGTGGTPGTGGAAGGTGGTGGAPATGGVVGTGGAPATGGTTGTGGTTAIPTHCTSALPAGAQAADVSHPTTVIGTGTAASCNFASLSAAVSKGGVITFNCGAAPVTIAVTSTMNLPTGTNTVLDGGGRITLDGQNSVQILSFNHDDFMVNATRVTLQNLSLVNGKATPTQAIPPAPAPCSQGWNDGEGGALYMRDGNLTVVNCTFSHNQAAPLGPDTGGGAIYLLGSKNGAVIVGSVFTNNAASNAGAVGGLFAQLAIYNSLFQSNVATGNGANDNDSSQCSAINNNQNEIGSGGNGAAIYQDGGNATNVILCGDDVVGNSAGANAFGGGVFMTSNDFTGSISVQDSVITGNTGGSWTQVSQGSVTTLGTAFGVNALSASVVNSTLQGR